MSKVRFEMDRRCIPQLLVGREMGAMLEPVAAQAAQNTRSLAPVDEDAPHYRDQITSEVGIRGDRYIGRVNANKETSGYIEFGTEDTPAFAPLRRGLEQTGLQVKA